MSHIDQMNRLSGVELFNYIAGVVNATPDEIWCSREYYGSKSALIMFTNASGKEKIETFLSEALHLFQPWGQGFEYNLTGYR